MKRNWLSAGLTAALLAAVSATSAQAAVFNVSFDTTPDATVTGPFVGTGTFSFNGAATDGTYALSALSGYNFDFTVNGVNFSNADVLTPVNNILVRLTTVGQNVFVNFGGSGNGPFGGSIDFTDGGNILSFQPGFGPLYFSGSSYGTYQAVLNIANNAVPEPLSAGLVAVGLLGIAASRRRRGQGQDGSTSC